MIETRLMDRTDVSKPMPLADWLRLKMDKRGLKSARALAKYAGLSPDTVSRALHGVQPEPETITKLAVYFGVPRDDLMAFSGLVGRLSPAISMPI